MNSTILEYSMEYHIIYYSIAWYSRVHWSVLKSPTEPITQPSTTFLDMAQLPKTTAQKAHLGTLFGNVYQQLLGKHSNHITLTVPSHAWSPGLEGFSGLQLRTPSHPLFFLSAEPCSPIYTTWYLVNIQNMCLSPDLSAWSIDQFR